MSFQVGKVYRHTTGLTMKVVGRLQTYMWGDTLVGETNEGQLQPVSDKDRADMNWTEAPDQGFESLYKAKR